MSGEAGDEVAHFRYPGAVTGDHGDYRHFELACEFMGIDCDAIFARNVHHIEGDQDGVAEFDHLDGVVEVTFEV